MKRILLGWILIGSVYIVTLFIFSNFSYNGNGIPTDKVKFNQVQLILGVVLVIIPYVIGGMYARYMFKGNLEKSLSIGLIPVIVERTLILVIGYFLVSSGGDGSMNGLSTLSFIQGEAAPYFTLLYIWAGLLSVLLVISISKFPIKKS